jgi:membrane protease YdiL (CAAX protease family)
MKTRIDNMNIKNLIKQHPVASYFILAYTITWVGSFIVAGPKFLRGEVIEMMDILIMWMAMLAGPSIAGITLTRIVDGKSGLRDLFSRMRLWRVGVKWYAAAIFIPPILIVFILLALSIFVSPDYAPGFFALAIIAGLVTGFFEEIGWTGYALPKIQLKHTALATAIMIGLLHGTWHLMAGYIGSVQNLGTYFIPNFITMWIVGMMAMRVLQVWVYNNTNGSVLLIQLMHASSSGFLIVFTPSYSSPANETFWFAVYAVVLWIVVAIVIAIYGKHLVKKPRNNKISA